MSTGETINATIVAVLTLVGVAIAAAQWHQAKTAKESEERQRKADERRFALEICEPLATHEIHEILNDLGSPPKNTSLVEAVFALCTWKVDQLLSDEVRDDVKIRGTIEKAMEPARAFLDIHGGPAHTESVERLEAATDTAATDRAPGSGADHTKYSWAGQGKHSKIWTINLIAQKWAADKQLTTREEFEESFLSEIRQALTDRTVAGDRVLRDTTSAHEKTNYVPELLLTLDGKKYGVTWAAGATSVAQIGRSVHKPIIEWFHEKHDYPAVPV